MDKKLLELFKIATEYADKSKENYMEVQFDYKNIEINIRNKESYDFLIEIRFYLENIDIDDVLNKIKKFIEEEENV